MKTVMTARDRELVEQLIEQVKTILGAENVHPSSLPVLCDLSFHTTRNLLSKKDVVVKSLLRVADTLGYEVLLVKRTAKKNEEENPDVVIKVQGYKDKIGKRKYSRYKKKTPEENGRERKRSSYKEDPDRWLARYSRRGAVDRAQDDDDFAGADGRRDEVS